MIDAMFLFSSPHACLFSDALWSRIDICLGGVLLIVIFCSSILISLPFDLVQRIILELQERLSFEGLQSLVAERESRRRYVIQEDSMYSRSTPSLALPDSLVWEEYVESVTEAEGSYPRISRRRTNHGTTSSS